MTILSFCVSIVALALSIASFRRSGAAIRRERVLRMEQRRQSATLSTVVTASNLTRGIGALMELPSISPGLDSRVDALKTAMLGDIEKLHDYRSHLEDLDPFKLAVDEADILLERIVGQLAVLHQHSLDLERRSRDLLVNPIAPTALAILEGTNVHAAGDGSPKQVG